MKTANVVIIVNVAKMETSAIAVTIVNAAKTEASAIAVKKAQIQKKHKQRRINANVAAKTKTKG